MEGGSLWSSLFSLGAKLLPMETSYAVTKVVPALATGALSGLANVGVDKIFGKGQIGGFLIPQNEVDQVQRLALLASIGVPLLFNALTGKGLQVDSQRSRRSIPVYVPKPASVKSKKDGGLVIPADYRSPLFIGTWEQYGKGKKKKKKDRV